MAMKALALAILLCTLTEAEAGTATIGTATARGDMRIDGYLVTADSTLFDGTVIETDKASAVLRLDKGVEMRLSNNARSTVHRDRLVLQQGSSEWSGSTSFNFPIEANTLLVTPSSPVSRGVVSMSNTGAATVEALNGELRVTNNHGLLLAAVYPGNAVSIPAPQAGAPTPAAAPGSSPITVYGTLSRVNGRYYLTLPAPHSDVKYELKGQNLDKLVGKHVVINGTTISSAAPGAAQVISVASVSQLAAPVAAATGLGLSGPVLIGGSIAVGAAAIGAGVFIATQNSTPASR